MALSGAAALVLAVLCRTVDTLRQSNELPSPQGASRLTGGAAFLAEFPTVALGSPRPFHALAGRHVFWTAKPAPWGIDPASATAIFADSSSQSCIGSSMYSGVGFRKTTGRWQARVGAGGKMKHLGTFDTAIEAALAYDDGLRALGLNVARLRRLNFLTEEDVRQVSRGTHSSRDSSMYNGVFFHRESGKWRAQTNVNGTQRRLGTYDSEVEAAMAYDDELRSRGLDFVALRNTNFLTAADVVQALSDDGDQGEAREGTRTMSRKQVVNSRAKSIVEGALEDSAFDLEWIPEGAGTDGIVRAADGLDRDEWMGLKVKGTDSNKPHTRAFSKTSGLDGLFVVLVALQDQSVWVIPGSHISVDTLCITDGGKWDAYRAELCDLPELLASAWSSLEDFSRQPRSEWRIQRSENSQLSLSRVEALARQFSIAGYAVERSVSIYSPIDLVVDGDMRLQVLTRTISPTESRFHGVNLNQRLLGKRSSVSPPSLSDFDALVINLMSSPDTTCGLFVIPRPELVKRLFVGFGVSGKKLLLYPPWSEPQSSQAHQEQAWQSEFFVPYESGKFDLARLQDVLQRCRQSALGADDASADSTL